MDFQFLPYTILFMRVKFTIIETHAHNLYLNIARFLFLRRLYMKKKFHHWFWGGWRVTLPQIERCLIFFFWSSWCTMRVNRELALCTSEDGISWWLESMDCLFGNKRAKFHRRSMGVIVTPPCKNWFFIFSLCLSRQKLGWNFMIDRFLPFTLIFFWLQSVSTDMKWY